MEALVAAWYPKARIAKSLGDLAEDLQNTQRVEVHKETWERQEAHTWRSEATAIGKSSEARANLAAEQTSIPLLAAARLGSRPGRGTDETDQDLGHHQRRG